MSWARSVQVSNDGQNQKPTSALANSAGTRGQLWPKYSVRALVDFDLSAGMS